MTGGSWLPSLPGTYPSLPSFVDRSRGAGTETTVIYPSLRRWIIMKLNECACTSLLQDLQVSRESYLHF